MYTPSCLFLLAFPISYLIQHKKAFKNGQLRFDQPYFASAGDFRVQGSWKLHPTPKNHTSTTGLSWHPWSLQWSSAERAPQIFETPGIQKSRNIQTNSKAIGSLESNLIGCHINYICNGWFPMDFLQNNHSNTRTLCQYTPKNSHSLYKIAFGRQRSFWGCLFSGAFNNTYIFLGVFQNLIGPPHIS